MNGVTMLRTSTRVRAKKNLIKICFGKENGLKEINKQSF